MKQGEFALLNAQLAFFFERPEPRPDVLYPDANKALGDLFTTPPIVMPVPEDKDLDSVPVVQQSNDRYRLNIARRRVDFFVVGRGREEFAVLQSDFEDKVRTLKDIFSQKNITIQRIGFVRRYFVYDESPAKTIAGMLANKLTSLQSGEVFESSMLSIKRALWGSIAVNDYVALKQMQDVRIANEVEEATGIELTLDVNTAQEQNYKDILDAEKIVSLIRHATLDMAGPNNYIEVFGYGK